MLRWDNQIFQIPWKYVSRFARIPPGLCAETQMCSFLSLSALTIWMTGSYSTRMMIKEMTLIDILNNKLPQKTTILCVLKDSALCTAWPVPNQTLSSSIHQRTLWLCRPVSGCNDQCHCFRSCKSWVERSEICLCVIVSDRGNLPLSPWSGDCFAITTKER